MVGLGEQLLETADLPLGGASGLGLCTPGFLGSVEVAELLAARLLVGVTPFPGGG
ncbi:MAG: hypothetical protein V3T72_00905 [Thermoanaerobaculia bacterium]